MILKSFILYCNNIYRFQIW